jgi:hypothetical protein
MPWGSYERWTDYVVRPLVFAGLPDPSEARHQLRQSADLESAHRSVFIRGVVSLVQKHSNGKKGLTARDIVVAVFGSFGISADGAETVTTIVAGAMTTGPAAPAATTGTRSMAAVTGAKSM